MCRLEESSVEKQLARRQLAVKGSGSCSWYIEVRKILVKYDLPSCWDLLDSPMKQECWRKLVNRKVNGYWSLRIRQSAELYPSLKYLSTDEYWHGRKHPRTAGQWSKRYSACQQMTEVSNGSYVTQSSRITFNQAHIDPTYMLCGRESETIEHVLTECITLEHVK